MPYAVEPLAGRHDRRAFDCGVESLNRYIQAQASQDIKRDAATVRVAVPGPPPAGPEIAGYYSLASSGVSAAALPEPLRKKMPRYPMLPAILLGRLAVGSKHRGCGLGANLLFDAFDFSLSSPIAWALFVTGAIDGSARAFYVRFGFRPLAGSPDHLYITRREIAGAVIL